MSDDDNDLKITHPHDHFFCRVFKDRENSISLVKDYLPPAVTQYMDLSGLKIESQRFVDRTLKAYESDLWLSVPLVKGGNGEAIIESATEKTTERTIESTTENEPKGRKALIHVIAESQTQPDRTMPFRLLGYMSKIWEQEIDAGQPYLSPIIPLVISQSRWPYSPSFTDMMDLAPELEEILSPWLPSFRHVLIELADLEHFPGRLDVQMAFSLLKFGQRRHYNPQDYATLSGLIYELSRRPQGQALLKLCLRYVANTAEADEFTVLKETIRTHGFENRGEEIVATYVQHYEETLASTQQALQEHELLLKQERLDKERAEQAREKISREKEQADRAKAQADREKEKERQQKEQERQEKERLAQKLREHGIDPDT